MTRYRLALLFAFSLVLATLSASADTGVKSLAVMVPASQSSRLVPHIDAVFNEIRGVNLGTSFLAKPVVYKKVTHSGSEDFHVWIIQESQLSSDRTSLSSAARTLVNSRVGGVEGVSVMFSTNPHVELAKQGYKLP